MNKILPITKLGEQKQSPPEFEKEKEFKGTVVKFRRKTFEFSHIINDIAFYRRVEWKKGVKQYLEQYVQQQVK